MKVSKTSANTRAKLPGVKRLWTKPDELLAVEWTGKNIEVMRSFVGVCRNEKDQAISAFRAFKGLSSDTLVGGDLYDSERHVWVPIEIGEWVMRTSQFTYQICDPEEITELYEEV